MTMKKILLILLTINIANVRAQEISAKLGPEQKDSKHGYLKGFAGSDENYFYAIRIDVKSVFFRTFLLEKYNKQLELIVSQPIETYGKEKGQFFNLESVILIQNKIFAISSLQNMNDKVNTFQAIEIDKASMLPTENKINLASVSFEDKSRFNSGTFSLDFSSDSSKILVRYSLPYEKGSPEKFGFKVYDKNFTFIWGNDIELPYENQLFEMNNFTVDNQSNVYLLGKVYEKVAKEKIREDVNYQYHVFSYSAGKTEPFEYIIDSKSNFFNEIKFSVNDKNEIICFGFYSNKLNTSNDGTFYMKLDAKSKKVVIEKLLSFKDYFESKGEDLKNYYFGNYKFKQFIHNPDGSSTLVAEQYRVELRITTSTSQSGSTRTSTTYIYHYDNIMVMKFDKEGNILWIKVVPKIQDTKDEGGTYMSYSFFHKNEKVYLFFNQPKMNVKKNGEQSRIYKSTNKYALLNGYSIDENGNLSEEKTLFDMNETKVVFTPLNYLAISDKQLIMFGRARKVNRFAEIIIE
jgi:hypothetical protein